MPDQSNPSSDMYVPSGSRYIDSSFNQAQEHAEQFLNDKDETMARVHWDVERSLSEFGAASLKPQAYIQDDAEQLSFAPDEEDGNKDPYTIPPPVMDVTHTLLAPSRRDTPARSGSQPRNTALLASLQPRYPARNLWNLQGLPAVSMPPRPPSNRSKNGGNRPVIQGTGGQGIGIRAWSSKGSFGQPDAST